MTQRADLCVALAAFDGRATSLLSELHQCFAARPGFHRDLIACLSATDPHIADGASWILKAEVAAGRLPSAALIPTLVETLPQLSSWQAQLHLCQCLADCGLNAPQAEAVMDWAETLTDHKRPFLRAWSLHVIVTLARHYPEQDARAAATLAAAETDPAASVRARARNLRKG